MMNSDRFERIGSYYDTLVNEFSHDPKACDYGSIDSQKIRFKVLTEVLHGNEKDILDIGCGFADFAGYLSKKYPHIKYTGYDLSSEMVNKARVLHPEVSIERHNIFEHQPITSFDVVTANGIFYLLGDNAFSIMKEIITIMYNTCKISVAFTSLSTWTENKEEGEFYADPLATVLFCRSLTPWVVLRHDYHLRDFTIYMYKEGTGFCK